MHPGPPWFLAIFLVMLASVSETGSSLPNFIPTFQPTFFGNYLNLRYKPVTRNIDTKNTKPCPTSQPIHLAGSAFSPTVLINTGISIQTNNNRYNIAPITGSVLGNSSYIYLSFTYYWATNTTTGVTGTTIDKNGFPYGVRVFYINKKYKTFPEALEHEDGFVDLIYLFKMCSTPNKAFNILSKKIRKLTKPKDFTLVPLITHIFADDYTYLSAQYYIYKGKFLDTHTNKTYLSSTVVLFKPNKRACITQNQFDKTFDHLETYFGKPLANVLTHDSSELQTTLCSGILKTVIP